MGWVSQTVEADVAWLGTYSFWVSGATKVQVEVATSSSAGSVFQVKQNGKLWPPEYPVTQVDDRIRIGWKLPTTPHHFTLRTVRLPTIHIAKLWAYHPDGTPTFVSDPAHPRIAMYGDSITVGCYSAGAELTQGGYADRFGDVYNVENWGIGGSSATCRGQGPDLDTLLATVPAEVLIAYGTNDITGDFFGCRGDIEGFRTAYTSILDRIAAAMPTAPVWCAAILPRRSPAGDRVVAFNGVIQSVVGTRPHVTYFDPSSGFTTKMTGDGLHPNAKGHRVIAANWRTFWGKPPLPSDPT